MPMFKWGLLLAVTLWLTACAGPQQASHSAIPKIIPPETVNSQQQAVQSPSVIETARRMLGTSYRYGGASPAMGFDCSGLVTYAYQSVGIDVPRRSTDQFRKAQPIALHHLQPGDLLFFRLDPPKVSHVAIYDQDGRFIHAPSSGKQVSYASLNNPYWRKHLVGAGRF